MAYDAEFVEGFDKYGVSGVTLTSAIFAGEWTTITGGSPGFVRIASALSSPAGGGCLSLGATTSGNPVGLQKSFGANYARMIGGITFSADLTGISYLHFMDSSTLASAQVSISINTSGQIQAYRGANPTNASPGGTLLGTGSVTVTANSTHVLEWDVTINNTTGIVKLWLDGVLILSLTGQNTRSSSNNYYNLFYLYSCNTNQANFKIDHMYQWYFLAGGGSETPRLDNPIVETQFPSSDSSVQFTPTAAVLGQDYALTSSTTNAPGANQLFLRKFTPIVNVTLQSVSCLPGATSAGANFKAVAYSDSSGSPGTLLSSGTQVTGATSGTVLTGALVTPQALTAGTAYWIGFITDTSVVLNSVDATTTGSKAANTYTSGAPGTAPAMTSGQVSWILFGNCTSPGANWAQVAASFSNPPLGDLSYNTDSTVGHTDLFGYPPLAAGSGNIGTVAIKAFCERSDAGARTVNLPTKSSSTTGNGSAAGQSPGTSYGWLASYFDTDPNTNAAWASASAVNSATSGISIAS